MGRDVEWVVWYGCDLDVDVDSSGCASEFRLLLASGVELV